MAEDALIVTRMNLGPAKKQAKLHDGWYINKEGEKCIQKMVFGDEADIELRGEPKGIQLVLTEVDYGQQRKLDLSVISVLIRFILVQNRQGKTRLSKWYVPYEDEEKNKIKGEVHRLVAPRDQKHQSNFVEFQNYKIIYRRYAGLFFCVCVDANDNELSYLEAIHFFVEVLDTFFGNVCELDLVYAILDEVFLTGEIEETSKNIVLTRLDHLDKLE
nr:11570_t:CDS:2 [Entrophospora candida]